MGAAHDNVSDENEVFRFNAKDVISFLEGITQKETSKDNPSMLKRRLSIEKLKEDLGAEYAVIRSLQQQIEENENKLTVLEGIQFRTFGH